jgi:hypothetical protein
METKNYIEWIGTGAGLNPVLGNTSFIIGSDERKLLVDCGFMVTPKLFERNLIKDITDIVLTHEHPDHIGSLGIFAQMNYFAYRKRGDQRPALHLGTPEFAKRLWEKSLEGGLIKIQTEENEPRDATLDTYFKVQTGTDIVIPSMPPIKLFLAPHVFGMENYGLKIGENIYYSGDSLSLPPADARLIFQDCQFYETKADVHISYDKLKRESPAEVRAKTYLVHLGGGWDKKDPKADGFAGFVKPGDRFEI